MICRQPLLRAAVLGLTTLAALAHGPASATPTIADEWRTELLVLGQPDQPTDYPCNRGVDCLSSSRSFYGGALRAGLVRPGAWAGLLTAAVGHASDYEDLPVGGFGVASLRLDFEVELSPRAGRLGLALRASDVVAVGWGGGETSVTTDFPGFAVLIGRDDLWGEVGIPTLPTQVDPRLFYAEVGWRTDRMHLEAGLASFGSLGFQRAALDAAGRTFGLWASARYDLDGPWEITGQIAVTYPCVVAIGIGYHGGRAEPAPTGTIVVQADRAAAP